MLPIPEGVFFSVDGPSEINPGKSGLIGEKMQFVWELEIPGGVLSDIPSGRGGVVYSAVDVVVPREKATLIKAFGNDR